MNVIMKLRNGLIKTQNKVRELQKETDDLRKNFSSYYKDKKGAFEIQDIFMMFVVGIMIYVFTTIWNPILALFNFSGIPYGSILELILNVFALILAGGYVAYMVKKWQTPS